VAALALAPALPAAGRAAAPEVSAFRCEIGDGRTQILIPRQREESSDDELRCHAFIIGLRPGSTAELVGELRIRARGGRVRVVATAPFERTGRHARLHDLTVPHATWTSALVWRTPRRPRLELSIHVFTRASAEKRWEPVASRALVLDHRRR
jgi:hypothetical protein